MQGVLFGFCLEWKSAVTSGRLTGSFAYSDMLKRQLGLQ